MWKCQDSMGSNLLRTGSHHVSIDFLEIYLLLISVRQRQRFVIRPNERMIDLALNESSRGQASGFAGIK